VVGTVEGYLHAVGHDGTILWSVDTEQRVSRAATLADLDLDGLLEIVLTSLGAVRVFEGDGSEWSGVWPVKLGSKYGITEAAAGDVDGDGHTEIAVVTYGYTTPAIHSLINLIRDDGSIYSGSWPVAIDTIVVAPPVLGEINESSAGLEVVVGALSGEVFAVNLSGAIWPSAPRMPGTIESSPILVQIDKDAAQEIAVVSRVWYQPYPPFGNWYGQLGVIDGNGTMITAWRKSLGSWTNDYGPVPSPVSFGGTLAAAGPLYRIYSWWLADADEIECFPLSCGAHIRASLAAGNIDGDSYFELAVPRIDDTLSCRELRGDHYDQRAPGWPMYRHDARRTGCWYVDPLTGDEHDREIPAVTRLAEIWPNPFNPSTTIRFSISGKTDVAIRIYDVAGRLVRVLQDGVMEAGWHSVTWNGMSDRGTGVCSGVYFCRMKAGATEETKKMVLLR